MNAHTVSIDDQRMRVLGDFLGARFVEVETSEHPSFEHGPELVVVGVAQKKYGIPLNCQCEVIQVYEQPPGAEVAQGLR